jgi:hypothetical protein
MKHTVKASVLTISTDHAFLSFLSSEAMLVLQKAWRYCPFSGRH